VEFEAMSDMTEKELNAALTLTSLSSFLSVLDNKNSFLVLIVLIDLARMNETETLYYPIAFLKKYLKIDKRTLDSALDSIYNNGFIMSFDEVKKYVSKKETKRRYVNYSNNIKFLDKLIIYLEAAKKNKGSDHTEWFKINELVRLFKNFEPDYQTLIKNTINARNLTGSINNLQKMKEQFEIEFEEFNRTKDKYYKGKFLKVVFTPGFFESFKNIINFPLSSEDEVLPIGIIALYSKLKKPQLLVLMLLLEHFKLWNILLQKEENLKNKISPTRTFTVDKKILAETLKYDISEINKVFRKLKADKYIDYRDDYQTTIPTSIQINFKKLNSDFKGI
jgi:DNA-binding MarR family transcriptional regulator